MRFRYNSAIFADGVPNLMPEHRPLPPLAGISAFLAFRTLSLKTKGIAPGRGAPRRAARTPGRPQRR